MAATVGSIGDLGHGHLGTCAAAFEALDGMMGGMLTQHFMQPSRASSNGSGQRRPYGPQSYQLGYHGASLQRNSSLLSQSLHLGHLGGQRDNVDNMSYKQLLQQFGDESENRGALSETISLLSTSTINNPEALPEDTRQCCICLEDFSRGVTVHAQIPY
jgi:hypothetical protein